LARCCSCSCSCSSASDADSEEAWMIDELELNSAVREHAAGSPQMYEGKRIQRCQRDNETWPCRTYRWAEALLRVLSLADTWESTGDPDSAKDIRRALDGGE